MGWEGVGPEVGSRTGPTRLASAVSGGSTRTLVRVRVEESSGLPRRDRVWEEAERHDDRVLQAVVGAEVAGDTGDVVHALDRTAEGHLAIAGPRLRAGHVQVSDQVAVHV